MAQDTATSDNITGSADVSVAAGLANPQYGYANALETFGIRFPDADFYNLGSQAAGVSGTIHVGGALDEISVFVAQYDAGNASVLANGNGAEGKAIFTADPNAVTWSLNFTTTIQSNLFVVVVDQTEQDAMTGVVSQSSPYVLSSDLAVAQAQSTSYRGGSFDLTGTSGAAGSFTINGSGGETISPEDGEGVGELIRISGGSEGDILRGEALGELIRGLAGNDTMFGGGGADQLYGNLGLDFLYGNTGGDIMFGGQDGDVLFGGQDGDIAYGNAGADVAYGNNGDDTLFGGQGADTMFGGQGDDQLFGNRDDDVLFGNRGDDTLTGGGGADRFAIGANQGDDIVTDFNIADGDRVLAFGQTTAAEVNGNTVLTASGGGGTLTLVGVDLATFNSSLPIIVS
ncbi:MAG: calcium-binding protein [Pseudomonadota bacterium]